MRVKQELRKEEEAEKRMWADLWAQDHQARMKREEREEQARAARMRDMMDIVKEQVAALNEKKALEKKAKARRFSNCHCTQVEGLHHSHRIQSKQYQIICDRRRTRAGFWTR